MRSNTNNGPSPAILSALWFGVQLIWGAVLGISLQARSSELAGSGALAAFGAISASGAAASAVVQLVTGPISDRMRRAGNNRTGFYAIGALLGAGSVVAFYRASSLFELLVAFVALQIALNIVIAPYQAIIPDTMPTARYGVASGWLAGIGSAGNAVGATLAAAFGGRPSIGYVLAAALVASAALTTLYVRRVGLQPLPAAKPLRLSRTLGDLFISRAFVYLGFYTTLGYLFFFIGSVLPQTWKLSATQASGLCILLFTTIGAAGAAMAARPTDRLDERLVVTIGGGTTAIAIGVLAAFGSPALIVVLPFGIAVAGVGWGIFLCADWAFACRLLPPAAMAATMAIWNLAIVGPQMLAPVVASAVLARLGALSSRAGPRDAMLLAGVEMLVGAAWIWRLPRSVTGKMGYGPDCMEPGEAGHAL
jgi:MFS family permease